MSWTHPVRARFEGTIQPAVVQIDGNYLVACCRRGSGYRPEKDGYIVCSESREGEWNWTEGVDSQFSNPNSAIELLKLKSGNLFLIYNDSMNDRAPQTTALSADRDKTWPQHRNIGEAKRILCLSERGSGLGWQDPHGLCITKSNGELSCRLRRRLDQRQKVVK